MGRSTGWSALLMCLQIVDYLDTLLLEVRYMWPVRWNLINVLFLVLRYLPLLHISIIISVTLITTLPWTSCGLCFVLNATLIHVNTACAEAVMFIRVHAIGGRSKTLGAYLVIHYFLSMAGIFTLLGIFYTTIDYSEPPFSRYLGCSSLRGDSRYLSILYGIILFNESAAMFMTMFIGYRKYLSLRKTPLWQIFYRQGTLYFLSLAITSMGNMLVNIGAKREFTYTFVIIQYALHNIFTTRMVLHIRQSVARSGGYDLSLASPEEVPLTTIAFAEPPIPSAETLIDSLSAKDSRGTTSDMS
ncbi:hypothetical protein BKA70DRAFT_230191 [Coprinopsis sp. MPI-PUGE-AT-0042]|nr:hypothetical protein BKA70DRAFT_230191 [Coprinopsis sp. MPI-PUGE-AT-0042]